MPSKDLYQNYLSAISAQNELETEMSQILKTADNLEESERRIVRSIAHEINVARGETNKAWKELEKSCSTKLTANLKFLEKLNKELDSQE